MSPNRSAACLGSARNQAAEPCVFYAATNQGLYRSPDAGLSWERLDLDWPEGYRQQRVLALAVVED